MGRLEPLLRFRGRGQPPCLQAHGTGGAAHRELIFLKRTVNTLVVCKHRSHSDHAGREPRNHGDNDADDTNVGDKDTTSDNN